MSFEVFVLPLDDFYVPDLVFVLLDPFGETGELLHSLPESVVDPLNLQVQFVDGLFVVSIVVVSVAFDLDFVLPDGDMESVEFFLDGFYFKLVLSDG